MLTYQSGIYLHLVVLDGSVVSGKRTRLPISPPVRDKLRAEKTGGDTYDDVILRLLDESEDWENEREGGL